MAAFGNAGAKPEIVHERPEGAVHDGRVELRPSKVPRRGKATSSPRLTVAFSKMMRVRSLRHFGAKLSDQVEI